MYTGQAVVFKCDRVQYSPPELTPIQPHHPHAMYTCAASAPAAAAAATPAPAAAIAALDAAVGAPAACLCAIVTSLREAPREVRSALDAALAATELHVALEALLGTLHSVVPLPLTALAATLWLVQALTAAVGGGWGSADATQWALEAALRATGAVLSASSASSAATSRPAAEPRESLLDASLELLISSARHRAAGGAASARTVATVLGACGPDGLGGLLGAAAVAAVPAVDEPRLSPPRREQVLRVASALIAQYWRALAADDGALQGVVQLRAAGLALPSDAPTFREALGATRKLHERWASGGAVGAAMAKLGGGNVAASAQGRSAAMAEAALQVLTLLLHARLEPSFESLHDDVIDGLHATLVAEATMATRPPPIWLPLTGQRV